MTPVSASRPCGLASRKGTLLPVISPTLILAVIILAFLLAAAPGCASEEAGREQVDAARASYQEIRSRAANLEQFFQQMEKLLWQKQGEELVKAATNLVDEESRAYDAFLRSVDNAAKACDELEQLGGEQAEYAQLLLALLQANKAEALLLKEAMVQVKEFVQPSLPSATEEITAFTGRQDELGGRILSSRDSIREMESEAEDFYLANLAGE